MDGRTNAACVHANASRHGELTYLEQADAVRREDPRGEAVEDAVEDEGEDEAEEALRGLGVVVEAGLCVGMCVQCVCGGDGVCVWGGGMWVCVWTGRGMCVYVCVGVGGGMCVWGVGGGGGGMCVYVEVCGRKQVGSNELLPGETQN